MFHDGDECKAAKITCASASRSTNKDVLWRPEFPGQRSCCMEQSASELHSPDMSLDIFKDKLKTVLFRNVY